MSTSKPWPSAVALWQSSLHPSGFFVCSRHLSFLLGFWQCLWTLSLWLHATIYCSAFFKLVQRETCDCTFPSLTWRSKKNSPVDVCRCHSSPRCVGSVLAQVRRDHNPWRWTPLEFSEPWSRTMNGWCLWPHRVGCQWQNWMEIAACKASEDFAARSGFDSFLVYDCSSCILLLVLQIGFRPF